MAVIDVLSLQMALFSVERVAIQQVKWRSTSHAPGFEHALPVHADPLAVALLAVFASSHNLPGADQFTDPLKYDQKLLEALAAVRGQLERPADAIRDDELVTVNTIAERVGVDAEALRSRIKRWMQSNPDSPGIINVESSGPRESKYIYRFRYVRHLVEDLLATGERPAKK